MAGRLLDTISGPSDLKSLSNEQLEVLAQDIRQEILATTSQTGGHVASSLGAVEIILAAHSLLDCPKDKLLFDVGHQAYAHKLLTGRVDDFKTLRTYGGISGFPKPSESPFDVHPSGHASDSLSVALGLAKSRDLRGEDSKIVTVIGDASISGGMAFEALNHIGQAQCPMVIILNDNEMSISRNVGGLMRHLGMMRATTQYREARDSVQDRLEATGKLGRGLVSWGRNMKESVKQFIIPHSMIFEQLGIVCTTPLDGHDIGLLREVLAGVLEMNGPVLMHVVTKKGVGFEPAVANPEKFHGVGPYDLATGASKKPDPQALTFTQAFGQALCNEARTDSRVLAITAAMKGGTGLSDFAQEFPQRFIDVGIAEGHAVGLASGLALGGDKPVVAVYSTFLQRAFDQIVINCALPKLDVVFAIDRAGVVGDDGPTHHGMLDIAYMRMIPNMKVLAPSDEVELARALRTALTMGGPFALRYPRGEASGWEVPSNPEPFELGRSRIVREGHDVAILAFGRLVNAAKEAALLLEAFGVSARVVDMRWVKPLDEAAIVAAAQTKLLVTAEGGVISGGAGEGVLDVLSQHDLHPETLVLGVPDAFVPQGKVELLAHDLDLDGEGIAVQILKKLGIKPE